MEILNAYKVVDVPTLPSWLLVLFFVGGVALAIIAIFHLLDLKFIKAIVCFISAIICIVLLLFPLRTYCKMNYVKERYEVRIDNTLSAVELVENWNIIEVRGNILVLERREIDEK